MGTYMQIWIWLFDSARHDLFAAMHCTISVVTGVRAVSPPLTKFATFWELSTFSMVYIFFKDVWICHSPFVSSQADRDPLNGIHFSGIKPVDGSEFRGIHSPAEWTVVEIPLFTTAFSTIPGGWPWDFWTINHEPWWHSHDVVVDARLYGCQLWPSSAPPSLRIHYGASSTKSLWPWQTSAKTSGVNWP